MFEALEHALAAPPMAVQGHLLGSDVLVWSSEAVDLLRTKWRIVGNLVGTCRQEPMQNLHLALPLLLLPEEVSLLLSKGVLEVYREKSQQDCEEAASIPAHELLISGQNTQQTLRDLVFRDLWEQGYYLTSALKYGGDFLVYSDMPTTTHSSYIAIVLPWEKTAPSLVSLARVAAKVKKRILLCSAEDGLVSYCTMQWAGIT